MDDVKGLIAWAVFLIMFVGGILYGRHLKRRIRERGIEAIGEISRISESTDFDTGSTTYSWYVYFRTEDGQEREALLLDSPNLVTGTRVRIKYDPERPNSAVVVKVLDE